MIAPPSGMRVWLATGVTDMRRGMAEAANSFIAGGSSYQVRAVLDSGATQEGLALTPDQSVDICADWDKKTIDAHCKEPAKPG